MEEIEKIKEIIEKESIDESSLDLLDTKDGGILQTGENFIKIYNFFSSKVDLRNLKNIYEVLLEKYLNFSRKLSFGKDRRKRDFEEFVLKNSVIQKIVMEVKDEIA